MANYGLKISSPYDVNDYNNKILTQVSGDLVLTESGVYEIRCIGDTFISHNLFEGLVHVKAYSERDNISILITANGELKEGEVADVYHQIVANHSDIKSKITARGVSIDNSKIIYRSSLKAAHNSTGQGSQSAKFMSLSNLSEIDAVPALDISSKNYPTTHSVSVSGIDKHKMWYLAMHAYASADGEQEIVEGFLNTNS